MNPQRLLLTYLTEKPTPDWFSYIKDDDGDKHLTLSLEEYFTLAKELEYYWRKNNAVPSYIDMAMGTIDNPEDSFQYKAVINIIYNILKGGKSSQLLAGTGTGKTYINFSVLDILAFYNYFQQVETLENTSYPFKCVYFTPKQVVDQTNEVKALYPNIKMQCVVINYETLRSKKGLGNVLIQWETKSFKGELIIEPFWTPSIAPCIIVCDENQKLKNNTALQTKLIQSYLQLKHARRIVVIHSSATPFVRPSESKTVVLSLSPLLSLTDENLKRKKKIWKKNNDESKSEKLVHNLVEVDIEEKDLSRVMESNFNYFIDEIICGSRIKSTDYSPTSMERLTKYLSAEDQLVHVGDVKFLHKSINKHLLIDFTTEEEKIDYANSYIEYIEELLKHDRSEPMGMAAIFVAMGKFRKKTEKIRYKHLAKMSYDLMKDGKNMIVATNYIETQELVYKELVETYGVNDNLISIIRGGQSSSIRTRNVKRFQDDESSIMLAMLQAGGVGLSLHHYKPRNKRPRVVLMPPVWSIIEMLQMLGRAHRINSASTTRQFVIWYRGTIEESIYSRLQEKSLSMRELMKKREQWSDLFVNEAVKSKMDLNEIYSKGSSEVMMKEDDSDSDSDSDSEDSKDAFFLNEEATVDNMVVEV